MPATVVAGVWTGDALEQMRTSGFMLLHILYEIVVESFGEFGIDVAGEGERTPDEYWQKQVGKYSALSAAQQDQLHNSLRMKSDIESFTEELERRMIGTVDRVTVTPLHGTARELQDIDSAIELVTGYPQSQTDHPFVRFEIRILYTNHDKIEATFAEAVDAVAFLETFA